MVKLQKAAIVGCGFVGASIAFALMQDGIFSELVLIDANRDKAEGEAMDLSHGLPFARPMDIRAGDYDDVADCALVIITAGAGQKPGETRLDLVHKNVEILRGIVPEIAKRNREAILLVVSNPVDVLTWAAWKLSGYPANRVLGSGTVLDTARLKYLLGERLGGDRQTFGGLAGMGDLIVTCTSMHSRNRRCGILIGQGTPVDEAVKEIGAVVEGYYAAATAKALADKTGVEMPITEAAYQVLYQDKKPRAVIKELMTRARKHELEDSWV